MKIDAHPSCSTGISESKGQVSAITDERHEEGASQTIADTSNLL